MINAAKLKDKDGQNNYVEKQAGYCVYKQTQRLFLRTPCQWVSLGIFVIPTTHLASQFGRMKGVFLVL